MAETEVREVYPELEPYDTGFLKVSDLHSLYYEQSGNPDGTPVVYLHGGPGVGVMVPTDRQWFDPQAYRIILFDQRGAGKSTPSAELRENTTSDLVSDMEKLRQHLNVQRWILFGYSWGSTLALVYSISHPSKVNSIIIHGIFLAERQDIEWIYQDGCSHIWPEEFDEFASIIPKTERYDIVGAYYRRLISTDTKVKHEAACNWSKWELSVISPEKDLEFLKFAEDAEFCLKFASIECHYFVHGAFLESDSYILDNVHKISHIPMTIINGRFDVITPIQTAWRLHKKLPHAELIVLPLKGHSNRDPVMQTAILNATDKHRSM